MNKYLIKIIKEETLEVLREAKYKDLSASNFRNRYYEEYRKGTIRVFTVPDDSYDPKFYVVSDDGREGTGETEEKAIMDMNNE
jgi:hypothetical protein